MAGRAARKWRISWPVWLLSLVLLLIGGLSVAGIFSGKEGTEVVAWTEAAQDAYDAEIPGVWELTVSQDAEEAGIHTLVNTDRDGARCPAGAEGRS